MSKMSWLLAAALLFSPIAAWAGQQDFMLSNNSGKAVNNVFVSDHSHPTWEEDILGQDVLGSGHSVRIHFNTGETGCFYDLRVDYVTGGNDIWPNINLCTTSLITLTRDDYGNVQARAE